MASKLAKMPFLALFGPPIYTKGVKIKTKSAFLELMLIPIITHGFPEIDTIAENAKKQNFLNTTKNSNPTKRFIMK